MVDAIRYGGSLILYLVVLYAAGGVGLALGAAMMGRGAGIPGGEERYS